MNLTGHFLGIRSVIASMRRAGGGQIVNTTSMTAYTPPTMLAHYVATKTAIIGLTRVAALELGADQIRVNAIEPGFIPTPMMDGIDESALAGALPVPRYGTPEEIADMMLYIVERASYSSGGVFPVDGGATAGVALG